jgi:hypothetical protein
LAAAAKKEEEEETSPKDLIPLTMPKGWSPDRKIGSKSSSSSSSSDGHYFTILEGEGDIIKRQSGERHKKGV